MKSYCTHRDLTFWWIENLKGFLKVCNLQLQLSELQRFFYVPKYLSRLNVAISYTYIRDHPCILKWTVPKRKNQPFLRLYICISYFGKSFIRVLYRNLGEQLSSLMIWSWYLSFLDETGSILGNFWRNRSLCTVQLSIVCALKEGAAASIFGPSM